MCHYNLINHVEVEPFLSSLKEKSTVIIGSTPFAGGLLSKRKKFKGIATLKSDLFYSLKELLPRQIIQKKKAITILNEISDKSYAEIFPLEFSLNSKFTDITIFGSLSKK